MNCFLKKSFRKSQGPLQAPAFRLEKIYYYTVTDIVRLHFYFLPAFRLERISFKRNPFKEDMRFSVFALIIYDDPFQPMLVISLRVIQTAEASAAFFSDLEDFKHYFQHIDHGAEFDCLCKIMSVHLRQMNQVFLFSADIL